MSVNTFKYIHFAHYKEIPNWSVQYVVEEKLGFTKKYPMAKIGSFLKKSKNQVEIQDDAEYKQVTVKINNGGVIARNDGQLKRGSEIGTKRQTVVHAGQFIVSKIDARNGAFGVIPDDLEGAIVTNDFPVFDVDSSKILPQFMVLISTTPQFVEFARKCSSGTTNRKRIDINMFLMQSIPLPKVQEQIKIIKAYNKCIEEVYELQSNARKVENKKDIYVQEALGIKSPLKMKEEGVKRGSFLHFLNRAKIDRWDNWNVKSSIKSSKYKNVLLKNIVKMQSGKFLPRTNIKKGLYNVYGGNGIITTHEEYIFEGKRIVIGRVGEKCGNVHLVEGKYWITDNALKVDKISNDVTYEYLEIALSLIDIGRFRVVSAQPSISQSVILGLTIPLPTLTEQNKIVRVIDSYRKTEEDILRKADEVRIKAVSDFEQTIFE